MDTFTGFRLIGGIAISVLFIVVSFVLMKPNKAEIATLKDWTSRDRWEGDVTHAQLESWYQTDTKYGNDFLYDFYFNATLNNVTRKFKAKGLVRPDDIHKLKKGLVLVVKYGPGSPPRLAVLAVNYE